MKLDSNNHSVFLLYYHLVLVVKYRGKVSPQSILYTELSKFINAYKSASSRLIKKDFPEVRRKL